MTAEPRNINVDRLIQATRHLVAVDTRNPPGNELPAVVVAEQLLAPLGASFRRVASDDDSTRVSLIAEIGVQDPAKPTLIINGHLDVVPIVAERWTRDPFGCELDSATGRLYGRGTTDMKGGIAAAIEAVHTMQEQRIAIACNVVFHLVADEELGGAHGAQLLSHKHLIDGDACIVPEPTDLHVCVAERGFAHVRITATGVPGHGSQPQNGRSAVAQLGLVAYHLHGRSFGSHQGHALLDDPTCNVGMINGGTAHNVIAERATIDLDRRLIPGMTTESVIDEIRTEIAVLAGQHTDIDPDNFAVNVLRLGEPSEQSSAHPWSQAVVDALMSVGSYPKIIGMPFTTDARFVRNQNQIPTVVCGPGRLDQAHTDDEYVEVDQLVRFAEMMVALLAGFGETVPALS